MIDLVVQGHVLVKNDSKAFYFVRDRDLFDHLQIASNQVQAYHETLNESTRYPSSPDSALNRSVPSSNLHVSQTRS